jgi:hypothetical protein
MFRVLTEGRFQNALSFYRTHKLNYKEKKERMFIVSLQYF